MTLRELLKQNELRVVEVAAGADGLARTISGAVMFDNPEMVNWMRAGEIMLTTGYFAGRPGKAGEGAAGSGRQRLRRPCY